MRSAESNRRAALPDRWLRDVFVGTGMQLLLRPGPLEVLWWQWFALATLLGVSWAVGGLLGKATRSVLRSIAKRTPGVWDDALVQGLGVPLTLAWGLAVLQVGAKQLLLLAPAGSIVDGLASAGTVLALFWVLWKGTGVAVRQMVARPMNESLPTTAKCG